MKKILAVIPARAGSKGIPNKNIRLINGKPLISYCIENALASDYITDIVVTTDSEEIELIAKKYHVSCIHRDKYLCGDEITLDEVVYDAAKNYDIDYIITMQPTSPTLKRETLDNAIAYAIKHQVDTLISVVNRPHLAWVERDGKVVPDYEKRLNRQYMPKRYLETGAFVISKNSVVTQNSRIGEKIDVFEIPEKESIDIDSFSDLIVAEHVLRESKIAIVVNGNNTIGLGHISRMLEIADDLGSKPDFYFNDNDTERAAFGNTTYPLRPYGSREKLLKLLKQGKYQLVINDILDTEQSYIKELKKLGLKVVNFEDSGTGAEVADMVINALYGRSQTNANFRCGYEYYFLPKLFMIYEPIEIKDRVENVFVCFGGADPQNYTETILNVISQKEYQKYTFWVVLGRAKDNVDDLIREFNEKNIRVLYDVKNMPEIMTKCDIAITSQGRTCYELASLGIPAVALAQNPREERHAFVSEENGFIRLPYGCKEDAIISNFKRLLCLSQTSRLEMHKKMIKNDLKKGRERIKYLLESL